MLRGAVTDSGHPNGTQRNPKSGISGRENTGTKADAGVGDVSIWN